MPARKISHQRIFKRFSQITGVPVKELMPIEDPRRLGVATAFASYSPVTHSIRKNRNTDKIQRHEERHGLQQLASSPAYQRFDRTGHKPSVFGKVLNKKSSMAAMRKWVEATNTDPRSNRFFEALRDFPGIKSFLLSSLAWGWAFSPKIPLMLGAYTLPQYVTQVLRHTFVRQMVARHGEDGLLLLWVAPPKKFDALQVRKWEKEMIASGNLLPTGGLSKKGMRYWREHLQPQHIWGQLTKAKKEREKVGLTKT